MRYRIHVAILITAILGAILFYNLKVKRDDQKKSAFSFGVIADCQYCEDPGKGVRKYATSVDKLQQCVTHFNSLELEFVVHLGDFIDRDFKSFDIVGPIYKQLHIPSYHVLGNHDFSVSNEYKGKVPAKLGLSSRYYDFEIKGWRFVVLDGNDISFHAYSEGSEQYKEAEVYYDQYNIESPKWNGAVSSKQLNWLDKVLKDASEGGERAVLYCHFPVYPENVHNLWNAKEVMELIEKYTCVKAYINGHNHAGNYGVKDGIHYLTMKGMVDTKETSYAVINVSEDQLKVRGFGREENRNLVIKK